MAPTEHLKLQWAEAAARAGIPIDPAYAAGKGKTSTDYLGIAVTYAGVAVNPLALRIRTERFKTLVILDEVHHAGDALSWGEGVREAFEPAHRRLALTGTPFRSDVNPIPFVTYAPGADGVPRSVADYTYGYAEALADRVVRPVLFMAYSGELQWRTRAGDEIAARLGEPLTKDLTAQALRTALDPDGLLDPVGAGGRRHPAHGGAPARPRRRRAGDRHRPGLGARLRQASSRRSPARRRPSCSPTRSRRSKKIAEFTAGDGRWMVAVRMVSEGVDVPRLAVGVYATTTSTPLFFAQAVGRFVRARARGETASVFLPSVPSLLTYAAELEVERDHVLGRRISDEGDIFAAENDLLAQAQAGEAASADLEALPFEALGSEAHFDRVLFDGAEFGHEGQVHVGSEEEMDFLGIPGPARARPDARAAGRSARATAARSSPPAPDPEVAGADHPRAARRAAPRAQRPGRRLAPPHRPAARRHPRRAAQGVRRPGRRGRQRRARCASGSTGCASGPSRQ